MCGVILMSLSSIVHRRRSPTILAAALLFTASIASIPTASANQPPTISGQPAAVAVVGTQYAFQPSASDPEGRKVRFSIANKPAWAKFSRFQRPPERRARRGLRRRVWEYQHSGERRTQHGFLAGVFDLSTRLLPNSAPTISGAPATTVTAGQSYSFTAVRQRCGRRCSQLQHHEQAELGDVQREHGPVVGYGRGDKCRLVREHRHQRERRQGDDVLARVLDHGECGAEHRAGDQRLSGYLGYCRRRLYASSPLPPTPRAMR